MKQPHVCNHADEEPFLIEWCLCPINDDHSATDPRVKPHTCTRASGEPGDDKGWWQNPVRRRLKQL